MEIKSVVISGAPGVGKSFLFEEADLRGLVVNDSDSTNFSWSEPGVRNPEWPNNYMEHLRGLLGKVDVICVSTHHEVRSAMLKAGIPFVLVYPGVGQKEEYLRRFRERPLKPGEDQVARDQFVSLMSANWESWIETQLPPQSGCRHIVLQSGQYLSDRVNEILGSIES